MALVIQRIQFLIKYYNNYFVISTVIQQLVILSNDYVCQSTNCNDFVVYPGKINIKISNLCEYS